MVHDWDPTVAPEEDTWADAALPNTSSSTTSDWRPNNAASTDAQAAKESTLTSVSQAFIGSNLDAPKREQQYLHGDAHWSQLGQRGIQVEQRLDIQKPLEPIRAGHAAPPENRWQSSRVKTLKATAQVHLRRPVGPKTNVESGACKQRVGIATDGPLKVDRLPRVQTSLPAPFPLNNKDKALPAVESVIEPESEIKPGPPRSPFVELKEKEPTQRIIHACRPKRETPEAKLQRDRNPRRKRYGFEETWENVEPTSPVKHNVRESLNDSKLDFGPSTYDLDIPTHFEKERLESGQRNHGNAEATSPTKQGHERHSWDRQSDVDDWDSAQPVEEATRQEKALAQVCPPSDLFGHTPRAFAGSEGNEGSGSDTSTVKLGNSQAANDASRTAGEPAGRNTTPEQHEESGSGIGHSLERLEGPVSAVRNGTRSNDEAMKSSLGSQPVENLPRQTEHKVQGVRRPTELDAKAHETSGHVKPRQFVSVGVQTSEELVRAEKDSNVTLKPDETGRIDRPSSPSINLRSGHWDAENRAPTDDWGDGQSQRVDDWSKDGSFVDFPRTPFVGGHLDWGKADPPARKTEKQDIPRTLRQEEIQGGMRMGMEIPVDESGNNSNDEWNNLEKKKANDKWEDHNSAVPSGGFRVPSMELDQRTKVQVPAQVHTVLQPQRLVNFAGHEHHPSDVAARDYRAPQMEADHRPMVKVQSPPQAEPPERRNPTLQPHPDRLILLNNNAKGNDYYRRPKPYFAQPPGARTGANAVPLKGKPRGEPAGRNEEHYNRRAEEPPYGFKRNDPVSPNRRNEDPIYGHKQNEPFPPRSEWENEQRAEDAPKSDDQVSPRSESSNNGNRWEHDRYMQHVPPAADDVRSENLKTEFTIAGRGAKYPGEDRYNNNAIQKDDYGRQDEYEVGWPNGLPNEGNPEPRNDRLPKQPDRRPNRGNEEYEMLRREFQQIQRRGGSKGPYWKYYAQEKNMEVADDDEELVVIYKKDAGGTGGYGAMDMSLRSGYLWLPLSLA
ncbi:hypothetical protein DFJ73DRAFT_964317 [Zopfochytrium polystomum]|nr:hypothetical protein DFJ73DRAFT_964317 [Zopfochytrium polystomum]